MYICLLQCLAVRCLTVNLVKSNVAKDFSLAVEPICWRDNVSLSHYCSRYCWGLHYFFIPLVFSVKKPKWSVAETDDVKNFFQADYINAFKCPDKKSCDKFIAASRFRGRDWKDVKFKVYSLIQNAQRAKCCIKWQWRRLDTSEIRQKQYCHIILVDIITVMQNNILYFSIWIMHCDRCICHILHFYLFKAHTNI